jgi:hypothetical protein
MATVSRFFQAPARHFLLFGGLRLLYRGEEALEVDGIRCVPCDTFLRHLVPGQPLP